MPPCSVQVTTPQEGPSRWIILFHSKSALDQSGIPSIGLGRTPTLDRARLTLGNVTYPEVSTGSSHETPAPTVVGLNLSARGTLEGLPAPPRKSGQKGELARLQATGQRPMTIRYQVIATKKEVSTEHLEVRSRELAILHHMQGSLRIWQDGVLEARVAPQGHARWCPICPPAMRETTVWQTHPHSTLGWEGRQAASS